MDENKATSIAFLLLLEYPLYVGLPKNIRLINIKVISNVDTQPTIHKQDQNTLIKSLKLFI
ncbi:hypothetical protein BCK_26613 (plasmid) [Bacillus cereus FRI-35]|nr:hypothetical protein BCK_26613 [Bacillus cereus FRI-35]